MKSSMQSMINLNLWKIITQIKFGQSKLKSYQNVTKMLTIYCIKVVNKALDSLDFKIYPFFIKKFDFCTISNIQRGAYD